MRRLKTALSPLFRAPHYAGALLFLLVAILLASCGEKKEKTPDWDKETAKPEAGTGATPEQPDAEPKQGSSGQPPKATAGQSGELRFLSYNLKNYLTMVRYIDGERQDHKKSEKEVTALVEIVVSAKPDVVGLCEIGTLEDLAGLQSLLKEAGLDLPHHEYAGGADETRHLALLSRFPIASADSQGDKGTLTYKSVDADNNPREFAMQRGILDATVQAGDESVRFLGVHLKSKREAPEGHQDLMRRNEAYLLRLHADRILESEPDTQLCVYGDFNDSRRSSPVRSIQGPSKSNRFLGALRHKDSRGEVWTHYWDSEHIYSRFDYVLASKALLPLFDPKQSRIVDDPRWSEASDHRPLLTIFKLDHE